MQFSISHLLIVTVILAAALGIGYPAVKFILYDNVNSSYDRDQSLDYVQNATTGQTRRNLLNAINQLPSWDNERIVIVEASLSGNDIHVELISTTLHQPKSLEIELDSRETFSVHSYELNSTGTYYFHGTIQIPDKIPDFAKIASIRFRDGESKSNDYPLSNSQNGG